MPVTNKTYVDTRLHLRPVDKNRHLDSLTKREKNLRDDLIKELNNIHHLKADYHIKRNQNVRTAAKRPESAELRYERHSVQRAVYARTHYKKDFRFAMPKSLGEKIYHTKPGLNQKAYLDLLLMRIYGKYGLVMNSKIRKLLDKRLPEKHEDNFIQDMDNLYDKSISQIFNDFKLYDLDKINEFDKTTNDYFKHDVFDDADCLEAIRYGLHKLIKNHPMKFESIDKLYRVANVKKGVYDFDLNPTSNNIIPGDFVADQAPLSSGVDAKSVIYRYSKYENAATTRGPQRNTTMMDEDEVLYVINVNSHLLATDLSGSKLMPIKQDKYSSGEVLITSNQKFKVTGIGAKQEFNKPNQIAHPRRVVFLEPTNEIPTSGTYKSMFDASETALDFI